MSSVPTSFYGIHPNDDPDPHQNFMAPIDASSNMDSGELFYTPFDGVPAPLFPNPNNISATQSPPEELPILLTNGVTDDAGLAPVFPMYNAFPHFQIPLPFAMTSSLFFSGLPTSPENTLTPSPILSCGSVPKRKRKRNHKSKGIYTKRIAADPAKSKRVAHTRRTRGPNRNTSSRPHYAGFEEMFVRSSCLVLDNYKRLSNKRNSHIPSPKNRISSRSKFNVPSTCLIPDVASP